MRSNANRSTKRLACFAACLLLGLRTLWGAEAQSAVSPLWQSKPIPGEISGGTADPIAPHTFWTWGRGLFRWRGQNAEPVSPANADSHFAPAGCALDANNDGATDLVLQQHFAGESEPLLVVFDGRSGSFQKIDQPLISSDCLAVHLFGRRGVLVLHRGIQLRFYYWTRQGWQVKELYSIYTPSWQGGLALTDIDRDGRPDIVFGNYWARSPKSFAEPWRLFAINVLHGDILGGENGAANVVLAAWPNLIAAVMRERQGTPLRWFHRPPNPEQLWPEEQTASIRQIVGMARHGDNRHGNTLALASETEVSFVSPLLRWPVSSIRPTLPIRALVALQDRLIVLHPSGASAYPWPELSSAPPEPRK